MDLINNIFVSMVELSTILMFSLLLHLFIFSLLISGYLGEPLKEFSSYIISPKQNLLIILIFFVSFFLIASIKNNIIYLEDKVSITTTIENVKFEISGGLGTKTALEIAGTTGAFVVGAKIAASLLAKQKIGFYLKQEAPVGGTAAGFTATFKLLNRAMPSVPSSVDTVKVETGPIQIVVEEIKSTNQSFVEYLKDSFGLFNKISKNNLINNTSEDLNNEFNKFNFTVSPEDTAKILKELDQLKPDWKNQFSDFSINSPLEPDNSLIQFVLDALNNHLIINFITVYLLLMLLFIIICKFTLNKDTKFNRLEKYPLGIYFNKLLIKYLSFWQKIGKFWIFFIIISLIFFNTVMTFSTYQLILLLK